MSALPLAALPPGLVVRARRLGAIRDRLATAIGEDEGSHIAGVNLHGYKLVIFADSSAWCTRLRYRTPELERVAHTLLGKRPQIQFRVQLPAFPRAREPRRPLPEGAVTALDAAARSLEKGSEDSAGLAAALRRLAGHGG